MSRCVILGLVALLTLPSFAAKRMTVAQLEKTLTSAAAEHKTDIEIANLIGRIELSESISAHTLEELNPIAKGPRTALSLQLLADVSSFLPLPASELPPIPPPDQTTQQRQLEATRKYAFGMLPRLPNLLATRTTYSFDDSPQEQEKGAWLERVGLHQVSTSKAEVSVLSERQNLPVKESASMPTPNGLVTWGEFGSVLLLILNDSAKGTTTWSHWEQTAGGPVSVFDYSVPKSASHYDVATPVIEDVERGGGSSRWWASGGVASTVFNSKVLRTTPAYHGSLWVDPASGTILRVSLVADLKGNPTLKSGAILVEYGSVRIKDQTFICPLRSLALSTAPGSVSATLNGTATEWLNENLFTDYHLFASTSRILTGLADSFSPATVPNSDASTSGGPPTPAVAQSSHPREETAAANQPAVALLEPLSPPVETSPHEPAVHAADVPAESNPPTKPPATQPAPGGGATTPSSPPAADKGIPDGAATLHLNVNAVLVPVAVRDRHGNFVDDLQKQDFAILDDGKPRPLPGFLVERHGLPQKTPISPATEAENSPGAQRSQTILPGRITVFVFDDLNMGSEQIAHAQAAALKVVDASLTGADMAAVVSTSGKVNSGLTREGVKLADAIKAVRPNPIYRPAADDCPKVGYYQADLIVNKHSEAALQDVISQVRSVCVPRASLDLATGVAQAWARRAVTLGQQGVRATYAAISQYVRRMAKLPGQHNMILVSSGFLPIDQEARYEESALMNLAADSNVMIGALDARGLYPTSVTADDDTRGRDPGLVANYQDSEMRAAENGMGELAYATGGDFFHNNNDLESGLMALLNAPETVYVLEFATDGVKANGAYHQLKVSVDRADVQVQARKGYIAPQDEPTNSRR